MEAAAANGNVPLNTTRLEALGLVARMSFARDWKGPVKWYLDSIMEHGATTGKCGTGRRMTGARLGIEMCLGTWSCCGRD
jgi:hypothetical protein